MIDRLDTIVDNLGAGLLDLVIALLPIALAVVVAVVAVRRIPGLKWVLGIGGLALVLLYLQDPGALQRDLDALTGAP